NAQLLRQHQQTNQQLKATLNELNLAQLQMIQQEKMSSLGHLIAGIAHEINNPTAFIYSNLGYVQSCTQDLLNLISLYQNTYPEPPPAIQTQSRAIDLAFIQSDLPKALTSIEVGGERICGIVRSLQNFSRANESSAKFVDIHQGLDDTVTILSHRTKACPEHPEIQVVKDYAALPEVECYPGLLNQVFVNLIANAIDALEEKIAASNGAAPRCSPKIIVKTALVEGQQVVITVSDNGPGISPSVQQHMFNPFFTTKPIGKGTGIGLSISYQIITQQHQGNLACFSTPGQGTAFVITIPVQQAG
ncbi:MAG: ATP-binding protein, partial [Cyanobacteria bacterium P01_A01_bin.135]